MSQADALERQMLDLINGERTSRGLAPVQLELRLNDSAEDHSAWMLQQDVFSHTGIGGSNAGERMADAGFQFSGGYTWAENIAWQSARGAAGLADDVANLHESLMNSPGHRANILSPSVEVIGIGVERGSFNGWDAVMVTQNFARTGAPVQLDTGAGGSAPQATGGNDVLELGSAGTLRGLAGNDKLTGSAGNDQLLGDTGFDELIGGAGADLLSGGLNGDFLNGGTGNDTLDGGRGHDVIHGGWGNDLMDLGRGSDRAYGAGGDDTISGGIGHDSIWAGQGNDIIDGGAGNDRMVGGQNADLFIFSDGNDSIGDYDSRSEGDKISLLNADGIVSFKDLMDNHTEQTGGGIVISDADGDSLLLAGIDSTDLQAGDFLF